MVRVTEFTFSPIAAISSSEAPCSALAPQHLITKKLPATPRRPTVQVESCTATSSLMNSVFTLIPSASASSAAISKAIRSPV